MDTRLLGIQSLQDSRFRAKSQSQYVDQVRRNQSNSSIITKLNGLQSLMQNLNQGIQGVRPLQHSYVVKSQDLPFYQNTLKLESKQSFSELIRQQFLSECKKSKGPKIALKEPIKQVVGLQNMNLKLNLQKLNKEVSVLVKDTRQPRKQQIQERSNSARNSRQGKQPNNDSHQKYLQNLSYSQLFKKRYSNKPGSSLFDISSQSPLKQNRRYQINS